jgi:hypothetical protein
MDKEEQQKPLEKETVVNSSEEKVDDNNQANAQQATEAVVNSSEEKVEDNNQANESN